MVLRGVAGFRGRGRTHSGNRLFAAVPIAGCKPMGRDPYVAKKVDFIGNAAASGDAQTLSGSHTILSTEDSGLANKLFVSTMEEASKAAEKAWIDETRMAS